MSNPPVPTFGASNPPVVSVEGNYGFYVANADLASELLAQYNGNVNASYSLLKSITEARLGHPIPHPASSLELLVMLASDDGSRMTSTELRDALASDEFAL